MVKAMFSNQITDQAQVSNTYPPKKNWANQQTEKNMKSPKPPKC
jgi:hypothetical protein